MSSRLVFSYLAFSTPQQSDGRSGDRQDSAAEVWAKANGFTLAASRQYRDEGVSRFHGEARMKGALSRFLALCSTPAVPAGSILVIEDFDRLSREGPDDAWELFRRILLAGVEIVVLSMNKWYKRDTLNDPAERAFILFCQSRAHQESAVKSRRIADIWADRRRRAAAGKGIAINPPSWIRRSDEGELELVPERAETIRLMVRLVNDGLGTHRVAGELSHGPNARPCWLRGGKWNSLSVQQILLKPAIWGGYQPGRRNERRGRVLTGEVVEGFYPAILTREEADSLRRLVSSRRNYRGRPCKQVVSILTRLVKDAETGEQLWRSSSGAGIHHFSLSRRWQGRMQVVAPYEVLETVVLRAVQKWMPDALDPRDKSGGKGRIAELLAELGQIAADREGIAAELSRPGRGASRAAIFGQQLDALDAREAEVKEQLADLDEVRDGVDPRRLKECQSLASQYKGLAADRQPAAAAVLNGRLRELLEGVWIYRRPFTARTAELIVQTWTRSGAMTEDRVFVGKPPADYRPLDVGGADFRTGFPSPLPSTRSAKKSAT